MAFTSKVIFYSASPFGTGDIKTGSPTLTISSGVATLTVAQTGNIGAGDCIDFGVSNTKVYIAPCRIAYNSGAVEIKINDKIRGVTSGAVGIVRAVEVTSGALHSGDATGYIYFSKVTGTFNSSEDLNRVRPTTATNIATTNGSLQGNMSTTFVVKDSDGTETANEGSAQTVNSISHVFSSLDDWDSNYTGASYINNTDLTAADILPYCCGYYDHDDQTLDTINLTQIAVTTDEYCYPFFFTPQGNEESINDQRHDGKWDGNRYIIETTSNDVISLSQEYTRFHGFQVHQNGDSGSNGITISNGRMRIEYNIIKATLSGGDSNCFGIETTHSTNCLNCQIRNNIIYDFINAAKVNTAVKLASNNNFYNNTIHNCYDGITEFTTICNVSNNIIQACTNNPCTSDGSATSKTNISENASASDMAFGAKYVTGTADDTSANKLKDADANFITNGVKVGCVVANTTDTTYTRVTALDSEGQVSLNDDIFVNGENYEIYTNKIGSVTFNNEGADDFHLGGGDSFAKNLGTNLSSNLFWDDIDGDERL